mmetsp:Transcript_9566/g.14769  ORF Transcript_9566/g.14769 Transcript_9566/m.14769 type:complete len:238 (+) Transcript_9566:970-1683(+)
MASSALTIFHSFPVRSMDAVAHSTLSLKEWVAIPVTLSSCAFFAIPNCSKSGEPAFQSFTVALQLPVAANAFPPKSKVQIADNARPSPYCEPSKPILRRDLYNFVQDSSNLLTSASLSSICDSSGLVRSNRLRFRLPPERSILSRSNRCLARLIENLAIFSRALTSSVEARVYLVTSSSFSVVTGFFSIGVVSNDIDPSFIICRRASSIRNRSLILARFSPNSLTGSCRLRRDCRTS